VKERLRFIASAITLFAVLVSVVIAGGSTSLAIAQESAPSKTASSDNDSAESEAELREILRWHLNDVFFLTPKQGWAVGGDGLILSTSNSGKNWLKRKIGDDRRYQILFQDSTRGWIGGENGVLRTMDGGRNWRRWSPPVKEEVGPYFVTPQVGWLTGRNGTILKTSDGGKSWARQRSGTVEVLDDMVCFTITSCIIVGRKNTILSTSNGGRTWIRRNSTLNKPDMDILHVRLTHDGTAWAVSLGYKYGYVLHSDDRGQTWKVAGQRIDGFPNGLFFFNAKRGVLLDGGIYLTEDSGNTWRMVWNGGALLQSVFFVNEKLGWAVGDARTIVHTADGGKTWVKQYDEEASYKIPEFPRPGQNR
jgi:photosystem II stability/assembly factor-like uncharacterized protein